MYDETIRRSASWAGFEPINFEHPAEKEVLDCFEINGRSPVSVILTGTAGDGKTHLCRQVWSKLGGSDEEWASDDPYLQYEIPNSEYRIHFIRDLSGWAPQQGLDWESDKITLLRLFCTSILQADSKDLFLVAANDGQLVEAWRRLPNFPEIEQARESFESLLVEDKRELEGISLKMFNLSRWSSSEIFDRAFDAFVEHPGWQACYDESEGDHSAFGTNCPIRKNYELLKTPIVRERLRSLIDLCHRNNLHLPIRQLLLLLTNAVLGHSDCNQDRLMRPVDVSRIIEAKTVSKASIYNNIFGGNLSENRRSSITVFDYLERFQIGYETTNRIDSILIFGEDDEQLGGYFDQYLKSDPFYGADKIYYESRNQYIEDAEDDTVATKSFLELLASQRRALFFKIPDSDAEELKLWDLTVFRYAGEYLKEIVSRMEHEKSIRSSIKHRLIKGLNRIFAGMFVETERELLLTTSGHYSQSKISRILKDRISSQLKNGEQVAIEGDSNGKILFNVCFDPETVESLELNLVRYEFLSRVAEEGALPANFSKECYEDILAFKSRLLAVHELRRQTDDNSDDDDIITLKLIEVSEQGSLDDGFIEIRT
ncbi:hypothetical protein [Pelagicoccus sp. SDUM812003]|uniref:hypothetical protein n=1 Tax=Pelagicoccus sp. SDUM812003 TaxID=3041267 RepID=UPI00280E39FF|nr:hypothetical protein [Pelagicoccus sp. SDUM812003]MDQ8203343.1 hypothetical protein [Pelagicoccus sp. SDUM812003]